MMDLLMNCFYDGMTVAEAVAWIASAYKQEPTARQIENAKKKIVRMLNKEWQ